MVRILKFKEKITLTLDSGLIKVHSNGIDTAKLLSMLVNQIVGILKGE